MKLFTILGSLFLAFSLIGCGGGESGDEAASVAGDGDYEAKSDIISKDSLISQHDGTTIAFSSYDIENESELRIVQLNPKKIDVAEEIDDDYNLRTYDYSVVGKSEFPDFIEIAIPYKASTTANVFALYYNPDTKKYESIDYTVDEANSEVNIVTDHLTTYGSATVENSVRNGTFIVKNENTRLAKIVDVWAYPKYVESYTASSVINEAVNNNMQPTTSAYDAGLSSANFWLGISAASNTLVQAGYPVSFIETLGNSFNAVGLLASVVQAGVDFQNGNTEALYTNILKNGTYSSVSYFGTAALQLAFVGVFAIDLSLNYVIAVTLNDNEENWKKVYDECYSKHYAKTHTQWYKELRKVTRDSSIKSTAEMQKRIEQEIDNNVDDLWDNALNIVSCQDSLKGSSSVRNKISQAKKVELVNALEPVFIQLEKKINQQNKFNYVEKLKDLQSNLNEQVKVSITENGDSASCAGYQLRFSPLKDGTNKSTWSGVLGENGSASTKFTVLGHMQAGYPNIIDIYEPDADLDTDKPLKSISFKMAMPQINIALDSTDCVAVRMPTASPGSKEFEGTIVVTLSSQDTEYIVYKINDEESKIYTGPITLSETSTIKAYADIDPYSDAAAFSKVAEFTYTKVISGGSCPIKLENPSSYPTQNERINLTISDNISDTIYCEFFNYPSLYPEQVGALISETHYKDNIKQYIKIFDTKTGCHCCTTDFRNTDKEEGVTTYYECSED